MKPEILDETPVSMAELKQEIDKIAKRDEEPSFRVTKTVDYLNQFVEMKPKEANELIKKVTELEIPRLKDMHVIKIVDLMPQSLNELSTILQAYPIRVSQDNQKKILAAIK